MNTTFMLSRYLVHRKEHSRLVEKVEKRLKENMINTKHIKRKLLKKNVIYKFI